MLTERARDILSSKSKFLAVNTQANASNRGFNTMARYKRADFASLTRYELALEERNQPGDTSCRWAAGSWNLAGHLPLGAPRPGLGEKSGGIRMVKKPAATFIATGLIWWAIVDSNHRLPPCEDGALTS